jgi:hypothetical protein
VRKDGRTVFAVTVPPNCTATVRLPGGAVFDQPPGRRTYSVETAEKR